MAVLRLNIWYALWGWKDLIQHVQGDTTVSVFPTDLGVQMKAKGVKLPEWQTLSLYFELYEFALWYRRPSTTDLHDIYGMMECNFDTSFLGCFSNLGNLTGAARGRMRDGISFLFGVCTKFYRHLRVCSVYCCVYCGRISMIQEGVLSSRVGCFECNEL